MTWPFDPFPPLSYDVILADPPWSFDLWSKRGNEKSPEAQYDVLSFEDVAALPVSKLGRGDCLLMMWACWPTLDQAIGVMKAWGFKYVTGGAWTKLTKNGLHRMGTGYRLRSVTEPYLIGTLGNPRTVRNIRNIIETEHLDCIRAENRGHSQKPAEQYEICERIMPAALRRIELFARRTRPGWDAFGNEVGKFDEVAS